jgi:hypothetical protein
MAAFEVRPATPAERSCSCREALGLAEGSVSAVYHAAGPGRARGIVGAYGYRPFGMSGMQVMAFQGRVSLSRMRAGIGFGLSSLAVPGYGERTFSVSLGISRGILWLQPGLSLGDVSAPGHYRARCVFMDLLIYAYPARGLRVSFEVGNAFATALDPPGGALPRRVAAGLGYAVSGSVACGIRLEKENGIRTALATGLEWRVARSLFLRLGSLTFPREFSVGIGLRGRGLGLEFSSTVNLDLGITHEAGVSYSWE